MNWQSVLAVFLGGGLGSIVRFGISLLAMRSTLALPVSTLLANLLACLIMFVGIKTTQATGMQESVRLLVMTGFCGGLSTFSTFSLETAQLLRDGAASWAILNSVLSVLLCVGILFLAIRN